MSIRRVTCPACNAPANVMATMTNIKCPSCGQVWNVDNPGAVKPAKESAAVDDDDDSSEPNIAVVAGMAAAAVALIAIAGLILIFVLPGDKVDKAADTEVETAPAAVTYREVDLPESTRQKIYGDYRKMAASSIEKKLPIPQDSPVATSLNNMLNKTIAREITHFSLLYNVTEEDIMQIVAEGDAKRWPGSRKPKK